MKNTLLELSQSVAISGSEHSLSYKIAESLRPFVTEVSVDAFGNLRAFLNKGKPQTLCLEAHIDEIGLIVSKVHDGGFLSFKPIGGIDSAILPATEVVVHGISDFNGVITSIPPHLASKSDKKKQLKIEDLFIDIGGITEGVSVGDVVSFKPSPQNMLGNFFCSKSLDNRASVAVLIETAKTCNAIDLAYNLEILATVQEEVGRRGSEMSNLREDVVGVITIDVTHGISPVVDVNEGYPLNQGVAIGIGPCLSRILTNKLKQACDKLGFPYTLEVATSDSGTNAWKFQTKNGGTEAGLVSIPQRYMHTPNEVINIETCNQLVRVLEEIACGI